MEQQKNKECFDKETESLLNEELKKELPQIMEAFKKDTEQREAFNLTAKEIKEIGIFTIKEFKELEKRFIQGCLTKEDIKKMGKLNKELLRLWNEDLKIQKGESLSKDDLSHLWKSKLNNTKEFI
jgi:phage regulator Rha-like protein